MADTRSSPLAIWLDGHWRENAGASRTVANLEQYYGLTLPDDFKSYLLHAAPSEDIWDDEGGIWWSVARVKNIPDEYDHELGNPRLASNASAYLFFADWLIWCWAWAICCDESTDRGKVVCIGGGDGFVAENFTDFATRYLADPYSVID